ncbi:MAG: glycosyltransferase family protein [Kiritimatiellia bacterium]|nr:glycosyltransferase [Lentisphaerota bacterium]
MKPVCLFMINGLGMGNSTRCYAVIEQLRARGVEVHVLTSGNGLEFFRDKPEIASLNRMENFFYSVKDNQISAWRTVLSVRQLVRRAWVKNRQLEALLRRLRPAVVVTDSEYTIGPVRRRRIPVVALNNADVVVGEYLRRRGKPRSIMGQFWLVEFTDYLFHRFFADLVISPAPLRLSARHARIRRVGLILRREVRDNLPPGGPFPSPRSLRTLLFMLSGSTLGTKKTLLFHDLPCLVAVIGRDGPSDGQVTYHGRVMHNTPHLLQADLLVVNGGFSAVSEALALNKPTLVIPVPRHAEQYVNAMLLKDLGRGDAVTEENVIARLKELYEADAWTGFAARSDTLCLDGAREAAEIIMEVLEKSGRLEGDKKQP